MNNLLIINYFFGDDRVPTARMVNDVAKELKKKNINFKIFCSKTNYKYLKNNHKKKLFEINPIKFFDFKFLNYSLFFISAFFHFFTTKYQKYLILTDPPFFIFLAPILKLINPKCEIIYWTMDLYPEALYASKIFPFQNKIIFNILKYLKNLSLNFVDKMINLDRYQNIHLKKYPNTKKILTKIVAPWDIRKIRLNRKNKSQFLKRNNLLDKKIVLYAGNLGRAHNVNSIINLVNYCERKKKELFFVFACKGKNKKKLYNQLKSNKNTIIENYFPIRETSNLLHSASFHLITLENDWAGIVYPSKLFGIIKTKKPVLYIGPSKTGIANLIESKQLGITFKLDEKPSKIFDKIKKISKKSNLKKFKEYDKNHIELVKFIFNKTKKI